jgi:hypothetical protein
MRLFRVYKEKRPDEVYIYKQLIHTTNSYTQPTHTYNQLIHTKQLTCVQLLEEGGLPCALYLGRSQPVVQGCICSCTRMRQIVTSGRTSLFLAFLVTFILLNLE